MQKVQLRMEQDLFIYQRVFHHNIAVLFQAVYSSIAVDVVNSQHLVGILGFRDGRGPVYSDNTRLELGELLPDFVSHLFR